MSPDPSPRHSLAEAVAWAKLTIKHASRSKQEVEHLKVMVEALIAHKEAK